MDSEIEIKVKYGWLHSRGHAKMYASLAVGAIIAEKLT